MELSGGERISTIYLAAFTQYRIVPGTDEHLLPCTNDMDQLGFLCSEVFNFIFCSYFVLATNETATSQLVAALYSISYRRYFFIFTPRKHFIS